MRKSAHENKFLGAGAATVDITPPLNVGLLMSSVEGRWMPFQSIRSRLKARVVVLEFGLEKIALVSLDLLGLTDKSVGGWTRFKRRLSNKTGIPQDRIVITCTHSHNAPESVAISQLYRTKQFRRWFEKLENSLAQAINEAVGKLQPCQLSVATTQLRGYSLQRRIPTPAGIVMSDSVQPISPKLLRRGPMDHRVRAIILRSLENNPIATIVHAACHPVHEMCLPQISSDFPGELCAALEISTGNGVPLFFNGAAGDINPTTVSGGADCARRHGEALAEKVKAASRKSRRKETAPITFLSRVVQLPVRALNGAPSRRSCNARLSALRIGSLAMAFVPGELFVETAWAIERASPFEQTLIVGFAESSIGYVPTKRAFREGGYEIGPGKWSFLQAGAEPILRRAITKLLRDLDSFGTGTAA